MHFGSDHGDVCCLPISGILSFLTVPVLPSPLSLRLNLHVYLYCSVTVLFNVCLIFKLCSFSCFPLSTNCSIYLVYQDRSLFMIRTRKYQLWTNTICHVLFKLKLPSYIIGVIRVLSVYPNIALHIFPYILDQLTFESTDLLWKVGKYSYNMGSDSTEADQSPGPFPSPTCSMKSFLDDEMIYDNDGRCSM